jgi:polysaccharide export outer membrane protein
MSTMSVPLHVYIPLLFLCVATLAPVLATDKPPHATKDDDGLLERARTGPSGYILGPDDQLNVWALHAEEISGKTYPVDDSGVVTLPLAGRLTAGGLTVTEFENTLLESLRKYIREPQVAVSVAEFRSQPVSVVGAVSRPGVFKLRGPSTLLEILTLAGGLRPDAGSVAKITRDLRHGRIPLPSAQDDPAGKLSVAEVNLKALLESENAHENILLSGHDIITVPQAKLVFVVGHVAKPGSLTFTDHRQHITVLQAVSMAGGLTPTAAGQNARILRPIMGGPKRAELPVNLKTLLAGKSNDVPLLPNDILFVPESTAKRVTARMIEAALSSGTTMLSWGLIR